MNDERHKDHPLGAAVIDRVAWTADGFVVGTRAIPEEMAVSMTYNRMSHAVMLASPLDLEDFGIGFSLAEGVIDAPGEIENLLVVRWEDEGVLKGMEVRMDLAPERLERLQRRRRLVAGFSGCGLCGLESLEATLRPVPVVPEGRAFSPAAVAAAVASLRARQALNRSTRAVHAAGFWTEAEGLVAIREDVGRHNALDKLHGAIARDGGAFANGIVVLTSRVSVELAQKAAIMGAPMLAAISAPTSLALETAERAGITLVAVARDDGFEICTHPGRITGADEALVRGEEELPPAARRLGLLDLP